MYSKCQTSDKQMHVYFLSHGHNKNILHIVIFIRNFGKEIYKFQLMYQILFIGLQ